MKKYIKLGRCLIGLMVVGVCCVGLTVSAHATGQYKVLYRWTGGADGFEPQSLIVGPSGSLFGVVYLGGADGVFRLDPPQTDQTQWRYSVIYSLPNGTPLDPNLLFDAKGNLYVGTQAGTGKVIRLSPPVSGQPAWKATVQSSYHGQDLTSISLTYRDSSGVLFGYDSNQHDGPHGALFKVTPPRADAPNGIFSVLTVFGRNLADGLTPDSLMMGHDGAFYGTTYNGGGGLNGRGILFRLTPSATGQSAWERQNLYVFGQNDLAGGPISIIADRSLTVYGVSIDTGAKGHGAIFRLAPPATNQLSWQESILHSFNDGVDGSLPDGTLLNHNGILFGVASNGGLYEGHGSDCVHGCGVLYKLTAPSGGPQATPWNKETLHLFAGSPNDGALPLAGPVATTLAGGTFALFGITQNGGIPQRPGNPPPVYGYGTVYEYIP